MSNSDSQASRPRSNVAASAYEAVVDTDQAARAADRRLCAKRAGLRLKIYAAIRSPRVIDQERPGSHPIGPADD